MQAHLRVRPAGSHTLEECCCIHAGMLADAVPTCVDTCMHPCWHACRVCADMCRCMHASMLVCLLSLCRHVWMHACMHPPKACMQRMRTSVVWRVHGISIPSHAPSVPDAVVISRH
eukprot:363974-Chlamydomonas_euryale.AAC.9